MRPKTCLDCCNPSTTRGWNSTGRKRTRIQSSGREIRCNGLGSGFCKSLHLDLFERSSKLDTSFSKARIWVFKGSDPDLIWTRGSEVLLNLEAIELFQIFITRSKFKSKIVTNIFLTNFYLCVRAGSRLGSGFSVVLEKKLYFLYDPFV